METFKLRLKVMVILLIVVLCLNCCVSMADGGIWYCPNCGRRNDSNFCPKDGTPRSTDLGSNTSRENYNPGDIVTFGHYEQDGNYKNGAEKIQWYILKVDGTKALLISRYELELVKYSLKSEKTTWEHSHIRAWLNDTFFLSAFNDQDRETIIETFVSNKPEEGRFGISGGNDTWDYVFLLSWKEYDQYLWNGEDFCERYDFPGWTEYVDAKGGSYGYWLRSPFDGSGYGYGYEGYAMDIDWDHTPSGFRVDHENVAARPCIWIDLKVYEDQRKRLTIKSQVPERGKSKKIS